MSNLPGDRGIPSTIIEVTPSGAEPAEQGLILIVAPSDPTRTRTGDEVAAAMKPRHIQSVQDYCREFDVRVEGTIKDEDGRDVSVSIPVKDENTFTVEGLVRSNDDLRRLYITSRLCDQLESNSIDGLNEAEIKELERVAEFLEQSLSSEAP